MLNCLNIHTVVNNFHGNLVNGIKMILFLRFIILFLCMFITEKKYLVLADGATEGLDYSSITTVAKYPINFTRLGRRFVLSLYCNGSNNFLLINAIKCINYKQNIHK